ncbi:MAG: hypothetical protein AB8D52_05755 [Gammaproteobacteria bacterium]
MRKCARILIISLFVLTNYAAQADGPPIIESTPDKFSNCHTSIQQENVKKDLTTYNIKRTEVANVLRILSDKYQLKGKSREKLLDFAATFDRLGGDLPEPDPYSSEFQNFDFTLGLSLTALTLFLNTNEDITESFSLDRDNAESELGLYLADLNKCREKYQSSLKEVKAQPIGNTSSC